MPCASTPPRCLPYRPRASLSLPLPFAFLHHNTQLVPLQPLVDEGAPVLHDGRRQRHVRRAGHEPFGGEARDALPPPEFQLLLEGGEHAHLLPLLVLVVQSGAGGCLLGCMHGQREDRVKTYRLGRLLDLRDHHVQRDGDQRRDRAPDERGRELLPVAELVRLRSRFLGGHDDFD